jgi:hypothetical protein
MSTIAYDSNGLIHHARNMDYLFPDVMRALLYEAHFKKDKRTVFKAPMFAMTDGV